MSLLKSNSVQIGQSATANQNFTLSVPASPDGTIKLARGNSGATTQDILSVNASGAVTLTNGGAITLAAAQATTSGTAIDFTGIPSWVKRVTVMFNNFNANGTTTILVQIGSGSIQTSGYNSTGGGFATGVGVTTSTSGFAILNDTASDIMNGHMTITSVSGNIYSSSHCLGGDSTRDLVYMGGGAVTLSGALDRVRLTTVGASTFNGGSVNIMYEG